jgi:hypothetical protein
MALRKVTVGSLSMATGKAGNVCVSRARAGGLTESYHRLTLPHEYEQVALQKVTTGFNTLSHRARENVSLDRQ